MSPLRILIQGGGVSGRTAAKSLATHIPNALITVLDTRKEAKWRNDRGVGLWPKAIAHLKSLDVDCDTEFCALPPASYRNNKGIWLSRCSTPSKVKVHTIRENRLLQLLEDTKVIYKYNAHVDSVVESTSGVVATLTTGETVTGDICIVASPPPTPVTRNWSDSLSGIVVDVASQDPAIQRCCQEGPYEILIASGVRLAVVPLGPASFFWFTSLPQAIPLPHSHSAVKDAVQQVLAQIECAYLPLSTLIQATCPTTVLVRRTHFMASNREYVQSLDGPTGGHTDAAAAAAAASFSKSAGRVLRIGDAANYLSNNLAQGASVGVEDGFRLGHLLADQNQSLRSIAEKFHLQKKDRVERCRRMNLFTQLLSVYPKCANLMQHVPASISEQIFDASLVYSLGGQKYVS